MKRLLTTHTAAVIVALCVGVIYFLPNSVVRYAHNRGIISERPLNLEEVFSYGVAVKEIMDGHVRDGDPYLFEYKRGAGAWDYHPLSLIPGSVGTLMHIENPEVLFEWLDFILPPISFLIFYALIFRATRHHRWSSLGAFMVIAFPNISTLTQLASLRAWEAGVSGIAQVFFQWFNPDFSRLFVPSLTMIFFAAFLYFSYTLLRSDARWRDVAAVGLFFGALFYVYFYYWVYATILLGLVFLFSLLLRRPGSARVGFAMAGGFLISIPHWLEFFSFRASPHYREYVERVGIAVSHALNTASLDFAALAASLIVLMWFLRARLRQFSLWGSAALISSIAVLNLQVIVGFNPQPDHWGSRVNAYVVALVGAVVGAHLIAYIRERVYAMRRIVGRTSVGALLAFFLVTAFGAQSVHAFSALHDFGPSKEWRAAFTWINEHTPKDAVFVTPSYHARILLPYFTHANVYLPMSCLTRAGEEEVVRRYLETYAFFKVPPDLALESFRTNVNGVLESNFSIFCDTYNVSYRSAIVAHGYREVPEERISRVMAAYRVLLEQTGSTPLSARADYVFWGPEEKIVSAIDPRALSYLKEVYRNTEVIIFEFIR